MPICFSFCHQGAWRYASRLNHAQPSHRSTQDASGLSVFHVSFPGRRAKWYHMQSPSAGFCRFLEQRSCQRIEKSACCAKARSCKGFPSYHPWSHARERRSACRKSSTHQRTAEQSCTPHLFGCPVMKQDVEKHRHVDAVIQPCCVLKTHLHGPARTASISDTGRCGELPGGGRLPRDCPG